MGANYSFYWLPCLLLLVLIFPRALHLAQSVHLASVVADAASDLRCDAWRLSAETNNVGSFKVIPSECEHFIGNYMMGDRYRYDSEMVAMIALSFAQTVKIVGDGNDVWVFDIDETLLSNLPYYQEHGFGSELFNATLWDQWVDSGEAAALPASLKLFNKIKQLGFTIILLSGRDENQRVLTRKNLMAARYRNWGKLILRGGEYHGMNATVYKSQKRAELVAKGFRIHGSFGDQWSDLQGFAVAERSFKFPNPMYYIA